MKLVSLMVTAAITIKLNERNVNPIVEMMPSRDHFEIQSNNSIIFLILEATQSIKLLYLIPSNWDITKIFITFNFLNTLEKMNCGCYIRSDLTVCYDYQNKNRSRFEYLLWFDVLIHYPRHTSSKFLVLVMPNISRSFFNTLIYRENFKKYASNW